VYETCDNGQEKKDNLRPLASVEIHFWNLSSAKDREGLNWIFVAPSRVQWSGSCWTVVVLWLVHEGLRQGIRHERVVCSLSLSRAVLHPLPFGHNVISVTNFIFPTGTLCTFIHWFSFSFLFLQKMLFLHLYSPPICNMKMDCIP
jgi:hypothetical protein